MKKHLQPADVELIRFDAASILTTSIPTEDNEMQPKPNRFEPIDDASLADQ